MKNLPRKFTALVLMVTLTLSTGMTVFAEPAYPKEDFGTEGIAENYIDLSENDDALVFRFTEENAQEAHFYIPEDYDEPIPIYDSDGTFLGTIQKIPEIPEERSSSTMSPNRSSVTRDIDERLDFGGTWWSPWSVKGTSPATTFTYTWNLWSNNVQDWKVSVMIGFLTSTSWSSMVISTSKSNSSGYQLIPTTVVSAFYGFKVDSDSWISIGKIRIQGSYTRSS